MKIGFVLALITGFTLAGCSDMDRDERIVFGAAAGAVVGGLIAADSSDNYRDRRYERRDRRQSRHHWRGDPCWAYRETPEFYYDCQSRRRY